MLKEIEKKIKVEKIARSVSRKDEETSSGSDSEGSEDGLDAEELQKLIPRRVPKRRIGGKKRKNNSNM